MNSVFFSQLQRRIGRGPGLLARLRRNVAGNTLAIMAIALIPLLFIAGSAVDTARLYMVKTRLQQACDAGALAGRRFMVSTNATTLDATATTQAGAFFANNFKVGLFGTKAVTFTPSKTSENQVAGTATATVPMTLTTMMGYGDQILTVTCEARYDVADTDIMFVLDTTGSMACLTSDGTGGCNQPVITYTRPDGTTGYYVQEKSGSKLAGLRAAVLNFYDTLAAAVDPATHLRYGFVTYTSTVNAGYAVTALSPGYIVDSWTYNSRRVVGDANNGTAGSVTYNNKTNAQCNAYAGRSPASGYTSAGSATVTTVSWTANNANSANGSCVVTSEPVKPSWSYQKVTYDTSQYKLGNSVDDPSKIDRSTSRWQGCVEERDTTATGSFDYSNLPADLDPDLVPTSDATRWRPMWPDVVYYRGSPASVIDTASSSTNPYGDNTSTTLLGQFTALNLYENISVGYVSCGKPVQRLRVMTRSDVSSYVNASDFVPQGGTYHDTGMIWGARLLSPSGLFAADTAAWPGRTPPKRYIVFMTDGDMSPSKCSYGMYGIENYDQRVAGLSYTSNCRSTTQLNNHNARFLAACAAAKARNVSIFVVGFGQTLTTQLQDCASPGQAFYAADNTALNAAFQTIAKRVAMLRITR
ncbi:TadE/TadG family type IV pilus assembly protein [Sphingomonas sp. R1]|uniref:TadE/TadG family type IV pilus assembly protein n=1 Tax=Sphingomonas sp. R1 TaxID=399176 RepID=UPI00222487EA|nr:TadE/TadG family type IV pilus assembly protein [Sphingomonas sp. R1]UYY78191.1 pilus assembly protein TadG-related protein [Sphingomonas sp. R1]